MTDEKKTEEEKDEKEESASEVKPATENADPAKQKEEKEESAPAQEAETEAGTDDVEIPAKFKDIVEKIESMSVLELNELVKLLEKKFGVSAVAAVAAAPGAGGAAEGAEEQDSFTVELASSGDKPIQVIKVIKGALGLGLKEAKDIVDAAPTAVKEEVKKAEAEELKKAIEEVGGKVNLK